MSSITMRCLATVDDLLDAIEALGGSVTWGGEAPDRAARRSIEVEVDRVEAYEATLSMHDEDCGDSLDPDPRDVRDFVTFCLAGDRALAGALLSRVVGPDGAIAAGEAALRFGGRA